MQHSAETANPGRRRERIGPALAELAAMVAGRRAGFVSKVKCYERGFAGNEGGVLAALGHFCPGGNEVRVFEDVQAELLREENVLVG